MCFNPYQCLISPCSATRGGVLGVSHVAELAEKDEIIEEQKAERLSCAGCDLIVMICDDQSAR